METKEKEALLEELERLKQAYKKEKAKLEWAEDDFEESLVREEMARLKEAVKGLKRRLEEEPKA
ncbi:hypothetical protein [Hydrogenimonas sp.]